MKHAAPAATSVEVPRPVVAPFGGRLRVLHVDADDVSDVRVAHLPLGQQTYDDAVGLPVTKTPDGEQILGAVYDREGSLIGPSQRARPGLRWRGNPRRVDLASIGDIRHLPGRTFFGGQLGHVFGHVLLETLPRFWRPHDYGAYDRVVLYPTAEPSEPLAVPELVLQVLELAGVSGDRIHVVEDHPVRFEHLDLVPSPIRLVKAVDPRMLSVFDRIADRVEPDVGQVPGPMVYLSRRRLEDRRRATNEDEIEMIMADQGLEVVHPQELPLAEQIAMARRATLIAGCDGSALHVALFARPGTKLLALDSRPTPNQVLIGWARGLDSVHVNALVGELPTRTDPWTADLDRVHAALRLAKSP